MYASKQNNSITLSGEIADTPNFSHQVYGEKYFIVTLSVMRRSGVADLIPMLVSQSLLISRPTNIGDKVTVVGQFRSYNEYIDNKSKLILLCFAQRFLPFDDTIENNILEIKGCICRTPVYRLTPAKREICDILVGVNRQFGNSDYIPCIAWGNNALRAREFKTGDFVSVVGRVQSRTYNKVLPDGTEVTRTAYEVSIHRIALTDDNGNSSYKNSSAAANAGSDDDDDDDGKILNKHFNGYRAL